MPQANSGWRALRGLVGSLALVLGMLVSSASHAQDPAPLTFAFAELPPFFVIGEDGEPDGYGVESLARIAEEAGFDYRFERVPSAPVAIQRYLAGELDGLTIIAPLPRLAAQSVFSQPLGQTNVRLFVAPENADDPDFTDPVDKRIGYVANTAGARVGLLDRNIALPLANDSAVLLLLMAGKLDGAITTEDRIYSLARAVRLDHEVLPVGEPLAQFDRVIALRPDHAALIPRIDAAIARLQERGELADMRRKWGVELPPPPPDVLTVGVAHYPPYQIVRPDGTFGGFAVDILRELADRSGLALTFREIGAAEFGAGPDDGGYDMLPQVAVSEARARIYDFTDPIEDTQVAVFTRPEIASRFTGPDSLRGLRIAVQGVSVGAQTAQDLGLDDLTVVETQEEVARLLLAGDVDAAIFADEAFRLLLEEMGAEGIVEVRPPLRRLIRAIALRPGLGIAREKLNAELPVFLASDDYFALRDVYFGKPVFWTLERQRMLAVVAGVLLLVILVIIVLSDRGRRQAERLTARTLAVSTRLEAVLNATQSGIVGLDQDGRIAFANARARLFMGETEATPPFDWPEDVTFVDADHMSPLDASKNPVNRALMGHRLSGETAIMRGADGGEPRYVRVSSARVEGAGAPDLRTVVVFYDVTDAEKQRQQLDRASRLDALGQLTGGIAHDFNNLLATIEFAVQLIDQSTEGETETRTRPFVSAALGAVRRGADLTQRLLAFAKRQPGFALSVRVRDVLAEFEGLVRPVIDERIDLRFEMPAQDLWVYCEVGQLENALLNLVLNGRDAILSSGHGGQIAIRVRALSELGNGDEPAAAQDTAAGPGQADRFVEFQVTDDGPGMSSEVLRRATDPFFTTKEASAGSGLGLSMVYGFVRQSGGAFRIYSEEGLGTTVRVILPRGTEQGPREAAVDRLPVAQGQGQRILVVEDEEQLLDMMTELLETLGYDTLRAASGTEALEQVRHGAAFDLLLTDIVMPGGIGGFELAREVRVLRPGVPVIYMSGYTGFSSEEMGDVVAPVLHKPSPPSAVAAALRDALQQSGEP